MNEPDYLQFTDAESADANRITHMKAAYKQVTCTNTGVNCIGDLTIVIDDLDIDVHSDMTVTIEDVDYDKLDSQPYSRHSVVVEKKTSQFIEISATGFSIIYDSNGRIYITLEPYYSGKVRTWLVIICYHKL